MLLHKIIATAFILFFALISECYAQNSSGEVRKVKEATEVMREIFAIPETAVPPTLLANAHAVVVLPKLLKAGFIVGGRYGTGLMMVRDMRGNWHYPVLVSLTGGSVGFQIGAQSTDVILVFKSLKSVDAMQKGKFTLGADASVAAGPVGRHAEADTDIKLESEIYSYSRSRGLFAGVALEGGALQIDHDATWALYSMSPYDILNRTEFSKLPAEVQEFYKVLVSYIRSSH